jgi:hypothetical protein
MSHTTASSHKKKKHVKKPAGKPDAKPAGQPYVFPPWKPPPYDPPSRNKITVILNLEETLFQLFYSRYYFFSEGGYTLDTLNYKNLN